jgi:hydrogenase nickel incorporation protein HypB
MCASCGCGSNHHHLKSDDYAQEIILETAILAQNNHFAALNRNFFKHHQTLALNLVSSPGSGKTTLLEKTINTLAPEQAIYVIEGDQQTQLDAQRIRQAGAEAYQINTGKACHLDGHLVSHALEQFKIKPQSLTFIENVGNLICPALFDLGEHAKVVLISTTEGEDKPLKYPDIFIDAALIIITKLDLLPYLNFNLNQCIANLKKVNNQSTIIELSSITGAGFNRWIEWLTQASQHFTGAINNQNAG